MQIKLTVLKNLKEKQNYQRKIRFYQADLPTDANNRKFFSKTQINRHKQFFSFPNPWQRLEFSEND